MTPAALIRLAKFSAVGALGSGAQLAALAMFLYFGMHYLPATALAVEFAILHNFLWHERWTWRDRSDGVSPAVRLVRFNLSAGSISLVVNLAGMRLLAGGFGMGYLKANVVSIAAGAAANFLAADRFAFRAA